MQLEGLCVRHRLHVPAALSPPVHHKLFIGLQFHNHHKFTEQGKKRISAKLTLNEACFMCLALWRRVLNVLLRSEERTWAAFGAH